MVRTCGFSVLRHTAGLRKAKYSILESGVTSRVVLSRLQQRVTMAAQTMQPVTGHDVNSDYDLLTSKLKDISALGGISGLLGWDEMVQLPAEAANARAQQKAALAGVIHEKSVDKELGEILERLQNSDLSGLGEYERATVREAAREYKKSSSVTEELVKREATLESKGYAQWVKAREASNFSEFSPVLKEWINARKERAAMVDASKKPYDVLADDYSAGLTAARVTEIFDAVKEGLIPFLDEIRSKGVAPDASWLEGEFDTDKQAKMCEEIAVAIGFDTSRGRLDVSVHPFTGGTHPTDVRMTTRFKNNDVTEGLTGAIHETGHALYEQGRNLEFDGLPVNSAAGMAIHESQSLLWERMVGLSLPFANYLLPKLRETFPGAFDESKTPEDLYMAMNIVKVPSLIRVESDEVTYPMHIILRFEIEKALVEGEIDVDDVPRIWNEKMQKYLGVTPESDAKGCLQDVHWSAGLFGYFPTYTLGAMSAVQIFDAAKKDLPNLESDISAGNFAPLKTWLNEKVHSLGSLYPTADDLLLAVTGKPLDPSIFLDYLKTKYSKIYKLA